MKAILVVLLLAGSAYAGCAGDECWPWDINLTGYEFGPLEILGSSPNCDPLTIEVSHWMAQQDKRPFISYWIDGLPETWTITTSDLTYYGGTSIEDGLGVAEHQLWIYRPDGNGGFLDPGIGVLKVSPTSNELSLYFDDCGYRVMNVPYTLPVEQVMGDSNLDGTFDSGDLVTVFIAGKYETDQVARWTEGDWSNDRSFDTNDFVFALQWGQYAEAPVAAVVPEPSAIVLMLMGLLLHRNLRRSTNTAIDD